jgi:hypothetical protein
MRIIVRGWGDGALIFQEAIEFDEPDDAMPKAMEHVALMTRFEKCLIEIEYLDEPDPLQRFFRMGNDAARMVMPVRIT